MSETQPNTPGDPEPEPKGDENSGVVNASHTAKTTIDDTGTRTKLDPDKLRMCSAFILGILSIALIICVNWKIFNQLIDDKAYEVEITQYVFWMYLVKKAGLVSLDIAATYFAVQLIRIAERLLLPLALDDARMRTLQGSYRNNHSVSTKDLLEIIKSLLSPKIP